MSNDLRQQIYGSLNQKESDDLIGIWEANDRTKWTDLALDVVKEILLERNIDLPDQNAPVLDNGEEDALASSESDDDNAPVFYRPGEVVGLALWIDKVAIAAIVVSVISHLIFLPSMQQNVHSFFDFKIEWYSASWFIAILINAIEAAYTSALYYFPLKGLNFVLNILMEMEFNSRSADH